MQTSKFLVRKLKEEVAEAETVKRCIGQTSEPQIGDVIMKLLYLEDVYKAWNDILVIGKTIERDNKKFHIVGMTLGDEAELYIIEPYHEPENDSNRKKGVRNQRKILKGNTGSEVSKDSYLQCSEICLGNQRLQVRSGSGSSLKYSTEDYEAIKFFLICFVRVGLFPNG
ncbi:MAG: hypothetical protein HDR04_13090 [Lachnospiraceae bacterium]|nr:hypothetical protein [Lachnospiraceae bacterium]